MVRAELFIGPQSATTMDGTAIAVDADALRTGLAAANVTVLTSSKGSETSEERESWHHGAFTKALLDSFNDPAADIDRNGLISTTGLAAISTGGCRH